MRKCAKKVWESGQNCQSLTHSKVIKYEKNIWQGKAEILDALCNWAVTEP